MPTVTISQEKYEALVSIAAKVESVERLLATTNYVTAREVAVLLGIEPKCGGTDDGEL